MRFLATSIALVALSTIAVPASADVPGPRDVCDAEGLGCSECGRHYRDAPEDRESFETCAAPLRAKGFVEACHHRSGAVEVAFFCPPGVKPETKVVGGGCGGCAVPTGAEGAGWLAFLTGAGFALARRRRLGNLAK